MLPELVLLGLVVEDGAVVGSEVVRRLKVIVKAVDEGEAMQTDA